MIRRQSMILGRKTRRAVGL